MSSQNVTHSDAVDNPERGVQRFQSQDKTRLQSLRGRYSSQIKGYYLVWDDIVAAFPNIDYLLVPTSHCLFLIDEELEFYNPLRLPVSSDDIATVVNCRVPHSKVTDNLDHELLLSDNSAHLLEPDEDANSNPIMDALSTLVADNSLVDLYIKLKMGMLTLKEFFEEVDEEDEERHIILLWYFNSLQRHERLLALISLLEDVGSSINDLQDDLADNRAGLDILHRAILAFEVSNRWDSRDPDKAPDQLKYPHSPLPNMFFVLPADASTWIPNDPRTHTYRLHFLCSYEPEMGLDTATDGIHLLDHPGYPIRDWDGFLKIHGYYILTVMQYVQAKIELDKTKIKEDEKIQDAYQRLVDGSSFSVQGIRELLDMAIRSLMKVIRVQLQLEVDINTISKARTFLEDEDIRDSSGTNKVVGLCADWDQETIEWRCPRHFVEKYKEVALDKLKSCAVSLEGDYDMALGVAAIKAHSMDQVTEFLSLLKGTSVATDLTICMLWAITPDELTEIIKHVRDSKVVNLMLESAVFKDHPFYSTEQACISIHSHMEERTYLTSIAFANIVNQPDERSTRMEYTIFTEDRFIVTTDIPMNICPRWDLFKSFMVQFPNVIGYGLDKNKEEGRQQEDEEEANVDENGDGARRHGGEKENNANITALTWSGAEDNDLIVERMALMTRLREISASYPSVQSLGFQSAYHQAAQFDMRDGAFQGLVNARFPIKFNEQLLYVGTLRRFTLEAVPHDPYYLSTLGNVLETNPKLTEVTIEAKESIILSQIVFCCRHLRNQAQSLCCTFYEGLSETEERVIAELMLRVSKKEEGVTPTGCPIDARMEDLDRHDSEFFNVKSVDIKVLQWVVDTIFEEMSDDEAAVLDMITAQVPNTLHSFVLDPHRMTRTGIKSLERVFSRSKIHELKIKCCSIENGMEEALVSALAHLNRSMLVSLQLRGDHIDAWLQILSQSISTHSASTSTTTNTPRDMRMEDAQLGHLVQFEVVGTAVDRRPLSALANWTLFQIIQSSSTTLLDVKFENMDLVDARDWALLLEEVETANKGEKRLRVVNCNTVVEQL
ncbi:hypothetical protein BG004_002841 [Podila humilis]|nr:hypothetical protein BG004_002841 [Podila humilis]